VSISSIRGLEASHRLDRDVDVGVADDNLLDGDLQRPGANDAAAYEPDANCFRRQPNLLCWATVAD